MQFNDRISKILEHAYDSAGKDTDRPLSFG